VKFQAEQEGHVVPATHKLGELVIVFLIVETHFLDLGVDKEEAIDVCVFIFDGVENLLGGFVVFNLELLLVPQL